MAEKSDVKKERKEEDVINSTLHTFCPKCGNMLIIAFSAPKGALGGGNEVTTQCHRCQNMTWFRITFQSMGSGPPDEWKQTNPSGVGAVVSVSDEIRRAVLLGH